MWVDLRPEILQVLIRINVFSIVRGLSLLSSQSLVHPVSITPSFVPKTLVCLDPSLRSIQWMVTQGIIEIRSQKITHFTFVIIDKPNQKESYTGFGWTTVRHKSPFVPSDPGTTVLRMVIDWILCKHSYLLFDVLLTNRIPDCTFPSYLQSVIKDNQDFKIDNNTG